MWGGKKKKKHASRYCHVMARSRFSISCASLYFSGPEINLLFLNKISEFPVGNVAPEVRFLTQEVGEISPTLTSKSMIAAVMYRLLALRSYSCLIKPVIHTAASNFDLWTRCYGVCLHKIVHNVVYLLLINTANDG